MGHALLARGQALAVLGSLHAKKNPNQPIPDMFLPTLQNVTFWRATRCGLPKIAQKIQEKAKNHQYLTKNVHVW